MIWHEEAKDKKIEVGTYATDYLWSDQHPYEVIKVYDQKHIVIRAMGWKVIKGSEMDGSAEYEYYQEPKNKEIEIKLFKTGWYNLRTNENNRQIKGYNKYNLVFGILERYYDPSF